VVALPTSTQAGRAAKVRTLLAHFTHADWRGPAEDLDWDKDMMRKVLGDLAGISEEELANV
jgi:hypothetical protein